MLWHIFHSFYFINNLIMFSFCRSAYCIDGCFIGASALFVHILWCRLVRNIVMHLYMWLWRCWTVHALVALEMCCSVNLLAIYMCCGSIYMLVGCDMCVGWLVVWYVLWSICWLWSGYEEDILCQIYMLFVKCREYTENKQKRKKQGTLPSASWRQSLCRRLADGKEDTWQSSVLSGVWKWPFGHCFAVCSHIGWRQGADMRDPG